MTDTAPIKVPTWAFAEPLCGYRLAELPATARDEVRLRSDDPVTADIHMIRHSEDVPDIRDLLRHLVRKD